MGIAAGLLAIAVSTTALARGCNGKDFSEKERCFLRQFPCIVAYFGIDRPINYPEALSCFEHERDWPFVVLMHLNGEGVSPDLRQAESLLVSEKWQNPEAFTGSQAAALEAAIRTCRQSPNQRCAHLDYCKDLADSTLNMEICDALDQVSDESALSQTIAAFENQLSPADRTTFGQVAAEFKAYQLAESRRVSDAVIPGTLYYLAGSGQAALVREDFVKLLAETRASGKLKSITYDQYRLAAKHLWRVYGEDIARMIGEGQEIDKEYRWVITDYIKAAQESQRHWLRLRDLLAKLAASQSCNSMKGFDPAMALKFAVTTTRLAELRSNPIGPSNHQNQTFPSSQLSP
ncbi:MAG: hypothetical protein JOZ29_14530 [Deltaproteobacteria bacterium]|nr:hypothetical protein [Deltaproteobacteria bacterium]